MLSEVTKKLTQLITRLQIFCTKMLVANIQVKKYLSKSLFFWALTNVKMSLKHINHEIIDMQV